MIGYKWLAEIYGVLCTDYSKKSDIISHQMNFEATLARAMKLQETVDTEDEHLEFLSYKKNCKVNTNTYIL